MPASHGIPAPGIVPRVAPLGDPRVDAAVSALIGAVVAAIPDAGLGFFLHGSWMDVGGGPDSDIDILALATGPLSDGGRNQAKAAAAQTLASLPVPPDVDFHLHPLAALIEDPYVDLRRTGRWLYGVDVRPLLPVPTLDALARESVSLTCQYVTGIRGLARVAWPLAHPRTDDVFCGRLQGRQPRDHAKRLSWLASARAASEHGYAPISRSDALRQLTAVGDPWATWVVDAVQLCGQAPPAGGSGFRHQLTAVCRETLEFENATLASIRDAIGRQGGLGTRCAGVVARYLSFA